MGNISKLPSPQDIEQAKESSRTLAKYADQERVTMSIKGEDGSKDDFVLSGPVMELLLQILTQISRGKAINLMPINSELTTQEAANLLNVSRPYLVKLLEEEQISHHKVGTHRRIFLKDLIEYMQENEKSREDSLEQLTALSQSLGLY